MNKNATTQKNVKNTPKLISKLFFSKSLAVEFSIFVCMPFFLSFHFCLMLVLFFRNICNILFNKDLCQDLHLLGESYGDCNLFQYFGNDHFKKSGKPPFYIIPSKI